MLRGHSVPRCTPAIETPFDSLYGIINLSYVTCQASRGIVEDVANVPAPVAAEPVQARALHPQLASTCQTLVCMQL